MANIVEQINDAIETRMAAVLSTGWTELKYKFSVNLNSFRDNAQRYGCIPQGMSAVEGVTRSYTVDQTFQLILTTEYVNKQNDSALQTSTFLLYDKMDAILKDLYLTKITLGTSIILNTPTFDIEAPEVLDEENVVALRLNLTVKYRQPVLQS